MWCVVSEVVFHPPLDTLFSPRTPEKRTWSLILLLLLFFSYFFLSLTRYLCGDRLCTPVHLHLQKAPLSKGALMNGSLIVRKHWWVQGKLVIKAHTSAECTHCFSRSPINFTLKVIIDSAQRFCEIFSSTAQRENSQGHFFQFYLEMMYTVCFN